MTGNTALAEMHQMSAALRQQQAAPASARQAILQRADRDYDPLLVAVDAAAIRALRWPDDPGHMHIELANGARASATSALAFLLTLGSINYRFWELADGQFRRYRFMERTGAKALWVAMEAAWGEDDRSALLAARLRDEGFTALFGAMPDPASRIAILHELLDAGRVDEAAHGLAARIGREGAVTVAQADWLAARFPAAFDDPYRKKAQLALSMFAGFRWGRDEPCAVSDLTAFADYQVPRVLRALGVLRYGDTFAAGVDAGRLWAAGSPEEVALRAATIRACEQIAAQVGGCAADVDNLLWQSQTVAGDTRFHLTETTAY